MRRPLLTALSLILVVSCASSPKKEHESVASHLSSAQPSSKEIDNLISEIGSEMSEAADDPRSTNNDPSKVIPMQMNREVEKWLRYFSEKDRDRFQRFLNRGEYYRPEIERQLAAIGVPRELYYLAMIESGFVVNAHSVASAKGIWQFIKPTGQRYGLEINDLVDERQDPVRSTIAAANYLKDLYTVFQSWFLAMAAYNAGESRIMNTIMRKSNRDFWHLARENALPKETMNYVPKFIAASIIGHHPEKFGFKIENTEHLPPMVTVSVPSRVKLEDIANRLDIPTDVLMSSNPQIIKKITPDHKATYDLWVPGNYERNLQKAPQLLASLKRQPKPALRHEVARKSPLRNNPSRFHVVRRGEHLAGIAEKYNITVSYLMARNNLTSARIYPGKRLSLSGSISKPKQTLAKKTYKVRKGDNLTVIARKFGLEISQIKAMNNLRRNHVYVGEKLTLSPNRG